MLFLDFLSRLTDDAKEIEHQCNGCSARDQQQQKNKDRKNTTHNNIFSSRLCYGSVCFVLWIVDQLYRVIIDRAVGPHWKFVVRFKMDR